MACGGASQSQLGVCKYMHDAPSYSLPRGLTRIVKDSKTRQEPNRPLFKSCFSRLLRLSAGPSSQMTQMYEKKKESQQHYLIGICAEVKVLQEAGGKLTEQEVVGLVDCPQTPVSVVVGAGAGAERTHCNTSASVKTLRGRC